MPASGARAPGRSARRRGVLGDAGCEPRGVRDLRRRADVPAAEPPHDARRGLRPLPPQAAAAQRDVPAGRVRPRARAGLGPARRARAEVPASEVRVAGLPADIASAVGKATVTDRSAIGRIQGSEGQKVRMRQFARQIDDALRPALGALGLPLILASAEPLASIYRSVNSYPALAPHTIAGNPETATPAELAEEARGVLDALYADELAELRGLFDQRGSQGRAAVGDHRHRARRDVRRGAESSWRTWTTSSRVRRRGVGRGHGRRGRRRDELRRHRRGRPQGDRSTAAACSRCAPRRHARRRERRGDPALPGLIRGGR